MTAEELFAKAIELPTGERSAFLEESCGQDHALRGTVERLLHHHERPTTILDKPIDDASRLMAEGPAQQEMDVPDLQEGKAVPFGDYVLVEEVGRGSMGVVYRARQESLKRTVALKMARLPVDANAGEIARFRSEAEVAASVEHPNIVPIYEVGEHGGHHYFSMQLVEGGTLKDFIAELRDDPRRAVALIITVARAVHAAHSSGLIHRDIKPGNILIDRNGEPHVSDFGLARRTDDLEERTLDGQMIGTPYYMAPEQAGAGKHPITTAVDIYSLGVVLYEALTGARPHSGDSMVEVLRKVAEVEPRPPRKVAPHLDRDLEAIILKSLNKKPEERYDSANALADDLERWMRGMPISARPVRTPVKVLKWMRRRPVYAMLWGGVALLLLVLGIGEPIAAVRQVQLKTEADRERGVSERARRQAEEARDEAEAVSNFLYEMLASAHPGAEAGGRSVTVAGVLDHMARELDADASIPPDRRAQMQSRIGRTYDTLGLHADAVPLLKSAFEANQDVLGPDHVETLYSMKALSLAVFNSGRRKEGLELQEELLERSRRVHGSDHAGTLQAMNNLAGSYIAMGRLDDGVLDMRRTVCEKYRKILGPRARATIDAQGDVAAFHFQTGSWETSVEMFEEVLALQREVNGPEYPGAIDALEYLARSCRRTDRRGEAVGMMEEVLVLREKVQGPRHHAALGSKSNLAFFYLADDRKKEGVRMLEEVRAGFMEACGPGHPDTLKAVKNLGLAYHHVGRFDDALELQKEILELFRETRGNQNPRTLEAISDLAGFYLDTGHPQEALELFEELLALFSETRGPEDRDTAVAMTNIACARVQLGQVDEAIALQEKALEIKRRVLAPGDPFLLAALRNLSMWYGVSGREAEAAELRKELAVQEQKARQSH